MAADTELWAAAPDVLRLFPSFVWKAQIRRDVYEPIDAALRARLQELRRALPPLEHGQSWQSGHALHTADEARALVACIDSAVEQVLAFLRIGRHPFRITGCWANINAPGAVHRMHSHPNNFLSGAYYLQVPAGADTINFHDPRPETGVIRPPVTELTAYNTDQVVVRVAEGTLLIFPAWLPHSVDANASEHERISVSFNVMFEGFAETMGEPLWGEP